MGLFGPSGKIQIQLNNFQYTAGDTIEGRVTLQLSERIKARGVFLTLYGIEESGSGKNNQVKVLLDFTQPLDTEKEYPATPAPLIYPFKLVIPSSAVPPAQNLPKEGALGTALQIGQMLGGFSLTKRITWTLKAKLDVAMKMDLSHSVQLTISPKS